ncbi:hypothetical protein [Kamptonema formosum]|uniref:hypothetical protein n=1 Tax=Kamptonema formosum TaxID=331992 RepID=UPI0012DE1696|nr:hypothetical protein [Oscillatoria sp. PCC 10802]
MGHNTLGKLLHSEKSAVSALPDVKEWISDYNFTVSLCLAVKTMKQVLAEAGSGEDHCCFSTPDGKLVLTPKALDILRSHCLDEHWEYFQNYLLA